MKTGWQQIDGKTYYFVENNTDPWYGRAMTGQQFIDGKEYNFDANGALLK